MIQKESLIVFCVNGPFALYSSQQLSISLSHCIWNGNAVDWRSEQYP